MLKREIEPTGSHGSSWGLTDLYDDFAAKLRQAIESGEQFVAKWGSKKEIRYAEVERCLVQEDAFGIVVIAKSHSDDGEDLVTDAIWSLASDENSATGSNVHPDWTDYLTAKGRTDHEEVVDQVVGRVEDDPNLQLHEPSFSSSRVIAADSTYEQVLESLSACEDEAERMALDNFESIKATVASVLDLPDPDDA